MVTKENADTNVTAREFTPRRPYHVEYPSDDVQEYYPWMRYSNGKNEMEIIKSQVEANKRHNIHVTTVFYFSPPGMGKTCLGYWLAHEYGNKPVQVINCRADMDAAEILGTNTAEDGNVVWVDGPEPSIILAANKEKFGVLIINEINLLPPEVQAALNALMDDQEKVVLTQHGNEVIKVANDAHLLIIASGNPQFLGTQPLNGAVRDRVSVWVDLKRCDPVKEAELYHKKTGLDMATALNFSKFAQRWREAHYVKHEISCSPSPRAILNWIRASSAEGVKTAFEFCMLEKFSETEEDNAAINSIARNSGMDKWVVPKDLRRLDPKEEVEKQETVKRAQVQHRKNVMSLGKELDRFKV